MDEITELTDLTDPTYWGDIIEIAAIECDWTAQQQAEWDAMYYALLPDTNPTKPLNDDFTTT